MARLKGDEYHASVLLHFRTRPPHIVEGRPEGILKFCTWTLQHHSMLVACVGVDKQERNLGTDADEYFALLTSDHDLVLLKIFVLDDILYLILHHNIFIILLRCICNEFKVINGTTIIFIKLG